jgi:molybdopterin-guanine dinucleotide biosynthesis protein MobB
MSTIPAIAFVGKKNSGKTTLLVRVLAELAARGRRVGTVKHHSHLGFDMDVEGKDSWRHRQAGSRYTVIASPDQIGCVRTLEAEVPIERIIAEMSAAAVDAEGHPELDVILVEGYRASGIPAIEIFRAGNPRDAERPLEAALPGRIAIATDLPRIATEAAAANEAIEDGHRDCPSGSCPFSVFALDDIVGIADFIERLI